MLKSKAGIKLFIGGLPAHIDKDELEIILGAHGTVVSAKIVLDHVGASRGFGFVVMASPEQAAKVIQALNGKLFAGQILTVQAAHRETQASCKTG